MEAELERIIKYLNERETEKVISLIRKMKDDKRNYEQFRIQALNDIRAALKSNYFSF